MNALLADHIWPLVICFIVVVAAYTIMVVTGHGVEGTLLRAVILSLGSGVVGFAGGRAIK